MLVQLWLMSRLLLKGKNNPNNSSNVAVVAVAVVVNVATEEVRNEIQSGRKE